MRSNLAERLERLAANASSPGFNPSVLRQVKSEGQQMKQCGIKYITIHAEMDLKNEFRCFPCFYFCITFFFAFLHVTHALLSSVLLLDRGQ